MKFPNLGAQTYDPRIISITLFLSLVSSPVKPPSGSTPTAVKEEEEEIKVEDVKLEVEDVKEVPEDTSSQEMTGKSSSEQQVGTLLQS